MLSPRSRGKGSRRWPGRDGGRRKQKPVEWRKQATHAVDDVADLGTELVVLDYSCPFGRSPAESIYLFDQEMARIGARYYAELRGSRRYPVFRFHVLTACADVVCEIIAHAWKR